MNVNKNYFHFALRYLPLYLYFTWHPTGRFSNNENKFLAVLCFDVTYRCLFQTDTLFAKCGNAGVPGVFVEFFWKNLFFICFGLIVYTAETPCISRQLPPPCSQVNNLFIRTEAFYFHSIISPYLDLSIPLSIEEIRGEGEKKKIFFLKKWQNDETMPEWIKWLKYRRPDLFKKFKLRVLAPIS